MKRKYLTVNILRKFSSVGRNNKVTFHEKQQAIHEKSMLYENHIASVT